MSASVSAETQTKKISPSKVIEALQVKASMNNFFHAVCTVWATRERARQQVTVNNLRQTMEGKGIQVNREMVEEVLYFLRDCGIGKLQYSKDRMVALAEIKVTLQSIGQTALNKPKGSELASFRPATQFKHLPQLPAVKEVDKTPTAKTPLLEDKKYKASLTVMFDNEPFSFPIDSISMKQIKSLIETKE